LGAAFARVNRHYRAAIKLKTGKSHFFSYFHAGLSVPRPSVFLAPLLQRLVDLGLAETGVSTEHHLSLPKTPAGHSNLVRPIGAN
jgi:hypothetical protein